MKELLITALLAIIGLQGNAQKFDPAFNGNGWRTDVLGTGSQMGQYYDDILIQGDHKVVVCGLYDVTNFEQDVSVVRYNTDGSLDGSFGNGGKVLLTLDATGVANSRIAQNAAGETFVTCSQQNANGPIYVCKLNANGTLASNFGVNGVITDSTFASGTSGWEHVAAITVQPDGKILIAGNNRQTQPNTVYAAWVIRYNTDGTRDNTFGNNGMVKVIGGGNGFLKLLIQPDGKILAGGSSGFANQQTQDWYLVRLNTDGTMDNTFGTNGELKIGMQYKEAVTGMGLQSDGSIIIGGSCGNGNTSFRIIKVTSNGGNDPNFGTAVTSTTNWGYTKIELQTFTDHPFAGLAVLPDDKIAIAGTVDNFKFVAIRFKADGDPDSSFGYQSVVDSQVLPTSNMGMAGAAFDAFTGRFYVSGRLYNSNTGVNASAVVAVKMANPNSVHNISGNKKIKCYPNPAGSHIHLENISGNISVFDFTGRQVLSANGNKADVSSLSSGIYLLKCITKDGEWYTGQFIKK